MNPKWYEKNPAIIILLIFFFPVGLFLMWKYSKWNKAVKIVISIFLAIVLISSVGSKKTNNIATTKTDTTKVQEKADDKKVTEAAKQKADEDAKAKADEEANKTVDQVVSEIAKNKFKDRLVSVTFEDNENTKLILTVKLADNITNNLIKTGMLKDVNDITKELSGNEKFKSLKQFTVVHEAEFVDKLGATSNGNAQIVSLSMDTIKKIQWNNFDYANFPSIATSYFIHPSFNKK